MKNDDSILHTKSYAFAVRIVRMVRYLTHKEKLMSPLYSQILRSGTSISANIRESEYAQSPTDFVSKLSISLKEANETLNWLELFQDTEILNKEEATGMIKECKELVALLISSIKTVKGRL